MKRACLALALAALALGGCTTTGGGHSVASTSPDHPEARVYDPSIDAKGAVDAALERAVEGNRLVLLAMGANWCHDSRAFAGWMETPRFQQLLAEKYELVYINVGMPQSKDGHNLDIAELFEIRVEGTPTVLVISPDTGLLNPDSATSWRNAASRSGDEIFEELSSFEAPAG